MAGRCAGHFLLSCAQRIISPILSAPAAAAAGRRFEAAPLQRGGGVDIGRAGRPASAQAAESPPGTCARPAREVCVFALRPNGPAPTVVSSRSLHADRRAAEISTGQATETSP